MEKREKNINVKKRNAPKMNIVKEHNEGFLLQQILIEKISIFSEATGNSTRICQNCRWQLIYNEGTVVNTI